MTEAPTGMLPDVMLFAAGRGTRVRPLTDATPKPLLSVAGTPLFDRALAAAMAEGHRRFVANIHAFADAMATHATTLRARNPGMSLTLSHEAELLETGGGLRHALPGLDGDPVTTLNTDSFWLPRGDTPLARMRALHAERQAEMVLLCVTPDRATGLAQPPDFALAPDGRLTRDKGIPVLFAGATQIARSLAASGPDGAFSLYRHMLTAAERGTLFGVLLDAPWFHAGDPEGLRACNAALAPAAAGAP